MRKKKQNNKRKPDGRVDDVFFNPFENLNKNLKEKNSHDENVTDKLEDRADSVAEKDKNAASYAGFIKAGKVVPASHGLSKDSDDDATALFLNAVSSSGFKPMNKDTGKFHVASGSGSAPNKSSKKVESSHCGYSNKTDNSSKFAQDDGASCESPKCDKLNEHVSAQSSNSVNNVDTALPDTEEIKAEAAQAQVSTWDEFFGAGTNSSPDWSNNGVNVSFTHERLDDEKLQSATASVQGTQELAESDPDLEMFAKAMQGVAPVEGRGRELPLKVKPAAHADLNKNPAYLDDFLQGKFEFALEYTEEFFEGHVMGLDPLVISKLRTGQYSPETHVDLHGQNSEQAYSTLVNFLRHAYTRGQRSVIVVTGRGKNSPGGLSVLRQNMHSWLTKAPLKQVVLAFCTAQPKDGGAGAIYVLLRKFKKSTGKIRWDINNGDGSGF